MRGLKILVIVMAAMLVAGSAALFLVIAARLSQPHPAQPHPAATAPIGLPPGARIESMSVGGDRVVVAVLLPDGNRQLLVIDLASGRQIAVIPLRIAP